MSERKSSSDTRLSELYENLSRYSYNINRLKGKSRFTMHKPLQIPAEVQHLYVDKDKSNYLDDLVLIEAGLPENPRVLDAGCGFGGSIFRWNHLRPGIYHGMTLSNYQKSIALREAQRRGVSANCMFYVQNYLEPINIKYHGIIAIESLIHSSDLNATLSNFTQALLLKGKLAIVDDMSRDEQVRHEEDYQLLKDYWYLTDIPSEMDYVELLGKNNLKIISNLDLTPQIRFNSDRLLSQKIRRTKFLLRLMPIKSLRIFLRTHLGGFALQKLYNKGMMKYQLIVAQKES
ncbi:MAG: hypothetical protein JSW33_13555 [bacterium]|nr:MAG: hypothetical protein JSW33_13555 [bacterium]